MQFPNFKFPQPLKTTTYLVATVDRSDIRPIYHERTVSIKSVRGWAGSVVNSVRWDIVVITLNRYNSKYNYNGKQNFFIFQWLWLSNYNLKAFTTDTRFRHDEIDPPNNIGCYFPDAKIKIEPYFPASFFRGWGLEVFRSCYIFLCLMFGIQNDNDDFNA